MHMEHSKLSKNISKLRKNHLKFIFVLVPAGPANTRTHKKKNMQWNLQIDYSVKSSEKELEGVAPPVTDSFRGYGAMYGAVVTHHFAKSTFLPQLNSVGTFDQMMQIMHSPK